MQKNNRNRLTFIMVLMTLPGLINMTFAQNKQKEEIKFTTGSWSEISAKAKKNNQYIFVDAYTSWCGPCKLLKLNTFKDQNAAVYFNKNFINVTIDMEKEEGITLAEKWDVTAYPTLLFFSPEGKMVLKQIGFVNAEKLIEYAREALTKN